MTPATRSGGWRLRSAAPRPRRRRGAAAFAAGLCVTQPAAAEIAYDLTVATDDRFRGRPISGERPVGTAQIAYDDATGVYLGVSGTLVATRDEGVEPLRSVQYVGYAHRLRSGLTVDIGVTNRFYSRHFTGEYARTFTEAYAGLVGRRMSARVFVSPDYDGRGGESGYGEVDALVFERGRLSASAHVGLLLPPPEAPQRRVLPEFDWRLGATRTFGRFAVSAQWLGSGPDHDTRRWQQGVVLSARRVF